MYPRMDFGKQPVSAVRHDCFDSRPLGAAPAKLAVQFLEAEVSDVFPPRLVLAEQRVGRKRPTLRHIPVE